MKFPFPLLAGLILAATSLAIVACSPTTSLNPAATSDLQGALNIGCPILSVAQSGVFTLNKSQQAAAATLALACPPNPPPTSLGIAAKDILSAVAILRPVIKVID